MDTRINNGMCRCCASDGTSKDLCSTYHWMGDEEVYSDMLKECFDITLETSNEGGICEVCITQLRNASNFKKQVLKTEQQFKNILQDKLFRSSIVKVEVPTINDEDSDNDNHMSEDFSGTDYEIPIKMETPEEPKSKKRAAKATTSRTKKARGDDGETSTKRNPRVIYLRPIKCLTIKENVRIKMEKDIKFDDKIKIIKVSRAKQTMGNAASSRASKTLEFKKHIHNVTQILESSNATPIGTNEAFTFACYYCTDAFAVAAELKDHTLDKHKSQELSRCVKRKSIAQWCIKLDITNLKCICREEFETLEMLMEHLSDAHGVKFYNEIKNQILTFKFDTDDIRCYICQNVFATFKTLLEHMNSHNRNFICEFCDAGFVNKRRRDFHIRASHASGTFACIYCPKTFNTPQKKRSHELYHTKPGRNKCKYCGELFICYRTKEKHLAQVHGVQRVKLKCQACDKLFENRRSLTTHTKRDHLMERRHECSECDMKFFKSTELAHHMVKHTGERMFKCNVCLKSYGRKTTLVAHMRIHNNDRRFKCDLCGQSFVQKCSWRSHMKSRHGKIV